jgi:hypothetical protein
LLLGTLRQPLWIASLIESLRGSEVCNLAAIVLLRQQLPLAPAQGSSCEPAAARSGAFSRLYGALDAAWIALVERASDPCVPIDISTWVGSAPMLELDSEAGPAGSGSMRNALRRLHGMRLDVILELGPLQRSEALLSAARFGCWAFGENLWADSPTLQAMIDGRLEGQVALRLVSGWPPAQKLIARSSLLLGPRSLRRNRRKLAAHAAKLARRALQQVRCYGDAFVLEPSIDLQSDRRLDAAPNNPPGDRRLLGSLARSTATRLMQTWRRRHGECWFLASQRLQSPTQLPLEAMAQRGGLDGFRAISCPPGRAYADPFLIEAGGETHVFFEDIDRQNGRGVISHGVISEAGALSGVATVLERPYHLSYPFLFRWQDRLYLLPETGANETVELYACQRFPDRWALERVLLSGLRAWDATLYEDDQGHWWMFAAVEEAGRDAGADLFLFRADSPLGPWQPHPRNPIQTDIKYVRPGGRLLRHRNMLLRPAQDGALRYGGGLWFMEVQCLTAERYGERPYVRFGPDWLPDNLCLHHFDVAAGLTIIDGMKFRPPRRGDAVGRGAG